MLRGAGDGQLRPMSERIDDVDDLVIVVRQDIAGHPLVEFVLDGRSICTQYVSTETAERLLAVTDVEVKDARGTEKP